MQLFDRNETGWAAWPLTPLQQICRTKSLISEDRSNKATQLLTVPHSLFKSYAKDFFLNTLEFGSISTLAVLLYLGEFGRRDM